MSPAIPGRNEGNKLPEATGEVLAHVVQEQQRRFMSFRKALSPMKHLSSSIEDRITEREVRRESRFRNTWILQIQRPSAGAVGFREVVDLKRDGVFALRSIHVAGELGASSIRSHIDE